MGRLGSGPYSHSLGQSGQNYWSVHRITPFQGFLYGGTVLFYIGPRPMFMDQALSGQKVERTRRTARGPKAPKGRDILTMGDAHRTGSNQLASPERASYFSGTTVLFKGPIPGI